MGCFLSQIAVATVSLSQTSFVVSEADGYVTVCVVLRDIMGSNLGDIYVVIGTMNGTKAGMKYCHRWKHNCNIPSKVCGGVIIIGNSDVHCKSHSWFSCLLFYNANSCILYSIIFIVRPFLVCLYALVLCRSWGRLHHTEHNTRF